MARRIILKLQVAPIFLSTYFTPSCYLETLPFFPSLPTLSCIFSLTSFMNFMSSCRCSRTLREKSSLMYMLLPLRSLSEGENHRDISRS